MVMCSEPMTRAPCSGFDLPILLPNGHQPGHLMLGQPDSLRPSAASDRSRTLNGLRPAARDASNGCVTSRLQSCECVAPSKNTRPATKTVHRWARGF